MTIQIVAKYDILREIISIVLNKDYTKLIIFSLDIDIDAISQIQYKELVNSYDLLTSYYDEIDANKIILSNILFKSPNSDINLYVVVENDNDLDTLIPYSYDLELVQHSGCITLIPSLKDILRQVL